MVWIFSDLAHCANLAQAKPAAWIGNERYSQALQQHQILLDLCTEVILH